MEYIGNYNSWIKDEWIDYVNEHDRYSIPESHKPSIYYSPPLDKSKRDLRSGVYTNDNSDIVIDHLPWTAWPKMKFHWWINKVVPSMIYPKLKDTYTYTNACRYYIPLQDHQSGHSFVHNDKLVTGYKRGDVFKYTYTDEIVYNYVANAGYTTLLYLNIVAGE
jgi:hypothetical protein